MADRLNDHLENIEDLLRGNEPTPVPPPSPYNQPDALDAHLRLIESIMAEEGVGMRLEIVNTLPETGKKSTIYLVPNNSGKADNVYDKYIWITDEERFESLNKDSFGFKTTWRYDTITNLLTDLNADETVAIGNSYHGEITGITKAEGLFNGNGELTINIMNKQISGNKIMLCVVTSNNVDPYHWEATFTGTTNNTGWIPFVPGTRTIAGVDLKDNITKTELQNALEWDTKQDALDQTQLAAVNSGATSSLIGQITTNQNSITTINSKIPNQATDQNQLADKEFVNSSISTNTATFRGTYPDVPTLLDYQGTVENNDYAFVINSVIEDGGNDWASFSDLDDYNKDLLTNFDYAWVINGSNFDLYRFNANDQVWEFRETLPSKDVTLNTAYNRHKATMEGTPALPTWHYEYTLNNSSFTSAQWAAINSGITASLAGQISGKADDNTVVHLAGDESITGTKTFTANQKLSNAKYLQGLSTNNTPRNLIGVAGGTGSNANTVMVGDTDVDLTLRTTSCVKPNTDNSKDLGNTNYQWKDIYMAGNITDGTNSINVAGITAKSTVSVSATGTSTNTVNYITINGVEKKLGGAIVNGVAYEEVN